MKQKCIVCSKAKGKRGCLLKGMVLICSRCCADIRHAECEGCSYYKDTQKYEIEKARKAPRHFVARLAPELDDEIDRALVLAEAGNIVAAELIIRPLIHENASADARIILRNQISLNLHFAHIFHKFTNNKSPLYFCPKALLSINICGITAISG